MRRWLMGMVLVVGGLAACGSGPDQEASQPGPTTTTASGSCADDGAAASTASEPTVTWEVTPTTLTRPTLTLPTPAPSTVTTAAPATSGPTTRPPTSAATSPPATSAARAAVVYRGSAARPVVALTFDAGSDCGFAAQILDTLAAEGITATFGMTGRWAEANPELVRRMVDEGHLLLNHTYSHPSFTGVSTGADPLPAAQRIRELEQADAAVAAITGRSMKPWFRPPYGDIDDSVNADVAAAGYAYDVLWTVDSLGWKGLSAAEIEARCLDRAGNGVIYLFHVGSQSRDAEALPAIVAGLRSQGYTFASVADIL